jgi:hypothetical protein
MRRESQPTDEFSRELFQQADFIASRKPRRARWRIIRVLALLTCILWLCAPAALICGNLTIYAICLAVGFVPAVMAVSMGLCRRFWKR